MCDLYANTMPPDATRHSFEVDTKDDRGGNAEPLPAIFPKGDSPVVTVSEGGLRRLERPYWGFVLPQVSTSATTSCAARPSGARASGGAGACSPRRGSSETQGRSPPIHHWFGLQGDEARLPFSFLGVWARFEGDYGKDRRRLTISSIMATTPTSSCGRSTPNVYR